MGQLKNSDHCAHYNEQSKPPPYTITVEEIQQKVQCGIAEAETIIPAFGGTAEKCFDQVFEGVALKVFYNFYEENFDPQTLIITKPGGQVIKTPLETKENLLHAIGVHASLIHLAHKCTDIDDMKQKVAVKKCQNATPDSGLMLALNAFGEKQGNSIALTDAYFHAIHQVMAKPNNTLKRRPQRN